MLTKRGDTLWVKTTGSVLRDQSGQVVAFQSLIEDISDARKTEQERNRLFAAVTQQREQLKALTHRLTAAEEIEQKRLARELHDQIGQRLTAVSLNLNVIAAYIDTNVPQNALLQDRLTDSAELVEQMGEQIRDLTLHLRPAVLDDYGLEAALEWYGNHFANRHGIAVKIIRKNELPRLTEQVENTLFRITQEALTNIVKHANATVVKIFLENSPDAVQMIIEDNGSGFETTDTSESVNNRSLGIVSMAERAEALQGKFRIESAVNEGTRVFVEVPT